MPNGLPALRRLLDGLRRLAGQCGGVLISIRRWWNGREKWFAPSPLWFIWLPLNLDMWELAITR